MSPGISRAAHHDPPASAGYCSIRRLPCVVGLPAPVVQPLLQAWEHLGAREPCSRLIHPEEGKDVMPFGILQPDPQGAFEVPLHALAIGILCVPENGFKRLQKRIQTHAKELFPQGDEVRISKGFDDAKQPGPEVAIQGLESLNQTGGGTVQRLAQHPFAFQGQACAHLPKWHRLVQNWHLDDGRLLSILNGRAGSVRLAEQVFTDGKAEQMAHPERL